MRFDDDQTSPEPLLPLELPLLLPLPPRRPEKDQEGEDPEPCDRKVIVIDLV